MLKIKKEYNIPELIKDIMESLVLTQMEFAAHLKCTQQSISSWLNFVRYPGREKMANILKLATMANLDPESYKIDQESEKFRKDISPYPKDVQELIISLINLHKNAKKKRLVILNMCLDIEIKVSLASKRVP